MQASPTEYKRWMTESQALKYVQEIYHTMKRQNLRILGIEEVEESQIQVSDSILKKIKEENIANLNKKMPINIHKP